MKLTVLGSGTSIPHPRRASSGYWLETSGGSILLDCSASIGSRMAAGGLDWANLDAIWISHFHLDHVGGLAPFLAGTKHAGEMKSRTKPLRIYGPIGIASLADRFDAVNNYRLLEQPFPVEILEIEALSPFEILTGVVATTAKTPHTPESHAIHIRDGETAIVYSADTGFDLTLASFANRVDLFIVEASFPRDKPGEKHLELAEAMHLIRKAKPNRAMLTHFYPVWDEVDLESEVRKHSPPCEVIEAVDGLILNI